MTNTSELKRLAEAAKLTGYQLLEMSINDMAEAQRLRQQFRQIRPEAILKLLAINAELVEALKLAQPILADEKLKQEASYGSNFSQTKTERVRAAHDKASATLAKAEGGEL